jgi:hypothetical protein
MLGFDGWSLTDAQNIVILYSTAVCTLARLDDACMHAVVQRAAALFVLLAVVCTCRRHFTADCMRIMLLCMTK